VTDAHPPHHYSEGFYRYQRDGSLRSARLILPVVYAAMTPQSVLDIGCGAGAWLRAYTELGVPDVVGVDGDYVERSILLFDEKRFVPQDISQPFSLNRRFDLVQCLEVAEHIPPSSSESLVDNLVRHGNRVLFSAAFPGQGGEDHINERPYEYWRDLFAARGYRLLDFVRPRIASLLGVEPWYRYNILFFAHDSELASVPSIVRESRLSDREPIRDYAPLTYRVKKSVLRHLSPKIVSQLALWKHRAAVRSLRNRR
jgi:SAM-dependent methyltransferase